MNWFSFNLTELERLKFGISKFGTILCFQPKKTDKKKTHEKAEKQMLFIKNFLRNSKK